MNDIVTELRAEIAKTNEAMTDGYARDILQRALLKAIAEIERLQCIAGAVSSGPSLADIKAARILNVGSHVNYVPVASDQPKENFRAHAAPGIVRDVDG